MKHWSRASFHLALSLLLALPSLFAQSTDVSFSGVVLDPSGAAVVDATVTMSNTRTGVNSRSNTNASGSYFFPSLQPGEYRLTVEKQGFRKLSLNELNLEVGARITRDLTLEIGTTSDVVEVVGEVDNPLSAATSSISGVITEKKVLELPVSSRSVLNLTTTAAGTNGANFNGSRRGNLNVQLDGINVMDARINLGVNSTITASVDRIAEFRVVTQPVDAELGRGSGQVIMISRSGTNAFHGSVFNFHRNTALNANTWFNNFNGIDREILIRNQYGGRIGGPIIKNRTFFHFLYEGEKVRSNSTVSTTVWTETMRRGVYRFFPGVQNGNALAARPTVDINGQPVRPSTATGDLQNISLFGLDPNRPGFDSTGLVRRYIDAMPLPNNFRGGDGLNTALYTWNRPFRSDTNNYNLKIDHVLNDKNRLAFSFSDERGDEFNGFMPQNWPTIQGGNVRQTDQLYQMTLTSTLTPTVINEFRAGAVRPRLLFLAPWELDPSVLPTAGSTPFGVDFATITDPVNISNDPQGRISPSLQFFNKTSMIRGAHNIKFGGQVWFVSTDGYNSFDVLPRAVTGAGGVPVQGVANVPGIGANQAGAQNILNDLNASLGSTRQAFNATGGSNPAFVPGEFKARKWGAPEFALFFQDDWKISKSLTLNFGLRYEWYGVPSDSEGRTAALVGGSQSIFGISGTTFDAMFRPGATAGSQTQLELIGPGTNNDRRLYNNDWNNFAPAIGIAWSLPWLGKDKTVFRAGYSSAFERLSLRLLDVVSGDQPGLRTVAQDLRATKLDLSNARFPVPVTVQPLGLVPLTDRTQTVRTYDSGLRVPVIHNFNAGITRSLPKGATLSVSYVGSKGTGLLRGADVNEHNIFENGILEAFLITQAGGNAPLFDRMLRGLNVPGRGIVNGTTLTGSQVLRDINTTTQGYFANNQVGTLASFLSNNNYLTGQNGGLLRNGGLPENFVSSNPQFASARLFGNLSNSYYHSLQVEYLQRTRDLTVQWNYTFSKAIGDEDGDAQEQNDSFRTQRNRTLDRRLLNLSSHHIMRSNWIYELPLGRNKSFLSNSGFLDKIVGGWQLGGIFNVFSGSPLQISAGGTTSYNNWDDNTPVNFGPIDPNMGTPTVTGNGVVYFTNLVQTLDPQTANLPASLRARSTRQAIRVGGADGPLLLANPLPGQLGPMNQRALYGPMTFRFDANVIKTVRITERVNFQFNAILENALNTPVWGDPNLNINDLNFGRITTAGGNRVVVLGGRINF